MGEAFFPVLSPGGFPPAQRGMRQLPWEQLAYSWGSACSLEGVFDLRCSCLFPQGSISARQSPSCSSLGLIIKPQVLDEAKQMAVSSCAGECVRYCLTERLSGEEIYFQISIFWPQNVCSLLRRQMTNLIIVKYPREQPGGARHRHHLNPGSLLPSLSRGICSLRPGRAAVLLPGNQT